MRFRFIPQLPIDGVPLEDIELDLSSRHRLIAILYAIRHLYMTARTTMNHILELINQDIKKSDMVKRGRTGLSCWENLVLSAVRLGCNFKYDHLADEASNHSKLRLFMGLGKSDTKSYPRSTIHDNLSQLSVETLQKISELIVDEGHKQCPRAVQKVRGDSFVAEKNIHYPTDSSLLVDGIGKMIAVSCNIAEFCQIDGWRQHEYLKRKAKRVLRSINSMARSKRKNQETCMKAYYIDLMAQAAFVKNKAEKTIQNATLYIADLPIELKTNIQSHISELQYFIGGTEYVVNLARRRLIDGEQIPNTDKVFSLFEPDTELINRGKQPNPIEFGHRVMIVEDAAGFILHCRPMDIGYTDAKVAVDVMRNLQQRYNHKIQSCSFDKGFWTPTNLVELQQLVPLTVLPKKGGLNSADKEREHAAPFKKIRKWHSGIESCIHSLVSANGLKRCRDKGKTGYERYVAMAVIGRNLLTLGRILIEKERKRQKEDNPLLALIAA